MNLDFSEFQAVAYSIDIQCIKYNKISYDFLAFLPTCA